jgi:hypothetical protein
MKVLTLLLVVFISGCGLFQKTEIIAPDGTVYKGRKAANLYAHNKQQEQLAGKWAFLKALAERPRSTTKEGQVTDNMLMQTLAFTAGYGSSGGEYFEAEARRLQAWLGFWGPIAGAGLNLAGNYLLYNNAHGGSISEEIHAGRDIVMTVPTTVSPPGTVIPPELGGYPGAHYSATFGGIGNQVSSPQGLNAVYRSTAAQNRASGSLQLDNNKPQFIKDNTGNGPLVDDRDNVRTGLFR